MKRQKRLLSALLALICVFSLCLAGCKKDGGDVKDAQTTDAAAVVDNTAEAESTLPDESLDASDSTEAAENITDASESASENAPGKPQGTVSAPKPSSKPTAAEIVSIYNTSANRIKKEATAVTRNYKKLGSIDKYLSLPSAISSIGKWAINTFVKGSDEPTTWTSKEDIKAVFPVGGTDYTSHLTADMVKNAELTDSGNAYKISLVLYDDAITSPKKGQGYAGVFNTVTASTFDDINVPGVEFQSVKVNGINGRIDCVIDKATMRITNITFKNADVLVLGVKVVGGNLNAGFALDSEENFSIKY